MRVECAKCGKVMYLGLDIYYQVDLSFKDLFGGNIFIGASEENHASFCERCKGAAYEFVKHMQKCFIGYVVP